MKHLFQLTVLSAVLALVGCGGGGGDGFYGPEVTPTPTPTPGTPTVVTPAAANLRVALSSNKPTLVATGDSAVVTVKLVDGNGGGVSAQNVVLAVVDYATNGVTFSGPSTLVTDASGSAAFTVNLPQVTTANTAALLANGVVFNASYTDSKGAVASKSITLKVVPSAVQLPIANITLSNSAQESTSTDGVYYTESFSANVVGIDGKPIVGQPVVLSIKTLDFSKGQLSFFADPTAASGTTKQWYDYFYKQAVDASNKPVFNTDGTVKYDTSVRFYTSISCPYTNQAFVQNAVTFVSATASSDGSVTYTTDSTGKFDFQVRFGRRYALWQNINLSATATVNGKSVVANVPYTLQATLTDLQSQAGQPFTTSPYGTNSDCSTNL